MNVKGNNPKVALAVICLVIGIMLALQYRTNLHSPSRVSYQKWSGQIAQMEKMRQQNDELAQETIAMRARLAQAATGRQNRGLKNQLDQANVLAGLTPVEGPGIVLILDDNPDPMQQNDKPEEYLVHDTTLLLVINQLNAAGAEAISINSERIIAGTEIRCAGPTILVNLNRVAPPMEIRAIGDPETLERAMRREGGDLENIRLSGIKVKIQAAKNIEVPAYNGILKFQYAKNKI